MTYREVKFHEIPDAYRAQTLARAEEVYGRAEADADERAYWDEQEEAEVRDVWAEDREEQNLDPERFVSEADMEAPSDLDRAHLRWLDDLAQHSLTL